MTFSAIAVLAAIGLIIGVISGLLGIGGGLLVIPALMFLLGFTQKQAIGTSMAMLLPPIGVFAFLAYWKAGQVNLPAAAVLAVMFAIGAWIGAQVGTKGYLHDSTLRVGFAILLLYVAANMLFRSEPRTRAAFETIGLIAIYAVVYAFVRLFRVRWDKKLDALKRYEVKTGQTQGPDYEI
ncbi:MAG: sulfite exporter TauE/SafE family protein [Phycisphaeraceae bacterium]